MRQHTSPLAAVMLVSAYALACSDKPNSQPEGQAANERLVSCARRPATNHDSGTTIVLDQSEAFPCEIHTTPTGVVLNYDSTGKMPDPAFPVFMDTQGRIFTAQQSVTGTMLYWNPDGSFNKVLGRPGNGPGEFNGWYMTAFSAPGNKLYVRLTGKWVVFDEKLVFEHELKSGLRANSGRALVLQNGRIVSSEMRDDAKSMLFHILDPATGKIVSAGKSSGALEDSLLAESAARPITWGGADQFWSAPIAGTGQGYTLQLWNSDGKVVRTIRRVVPWYPEGSDLYGPAKMEKLRSASQRREDGTIGPVEDHGVVRKPPTSITDIYVDGNGLLWVYVSVATDRWVHIEEREERVRAYDAMFDHYVEVIDPDAGVVLASQRVQPRAIGVTSHQFPRTSMKYEVRQDSLDRTTISFLRLELRPVVK